MTLLDRPRERSAPAPIAAYQRRQVDRQQTFRRDLTFQCGTDLLSQGGHVRAVVTGVLRSPCCGAAIGPPE